MWVGLAGGGTHAPARRTLRPAQRQAWLTLIEFAGIIVVTVALISAVLKRARAQMRSGVAET